MTKTIRVSERKSERVDRARIALEAKRSFRPLVVYAIGFAIFVFGGMGYVRSKLPGGQLGDAQEIRFVVDDASGITPGQSELRIKGIPAGVLSAVEMRGGRPIVSAKVREEFTPVFQDASLAVRPNTALEDNYADIVDRGSPAAGRATRDRPLRAEQVAASVQVEDVLNALQPDVRTHLGAMLDQLGRGLGERGDDLRAAFVKAVPLLRVAGRLTHELKERSRLTKSLVHDTALLTGELARRERGLRGLVRNGAVTFDQLAASARPLDATLAELAPTLRAVFTSFEALRGVLPDVDRAVEALQPVARSLPTALPAVRALGKSADPALDALRRPVDRLVSLARNLAPLARDLDAAVTALRPQMGAIDHVTKSTAGCGQAIQRFFQWTPSVFKFGDSRAHAARGDFAFSIDTASAARDPNVFIGKSCAPGAPKRATP